VAGNLSSAGTFKLKKLDLQAEGFNPCQIKDKMYFLSGGQYVPLTEKLYEDIMSGRIRL
jgi:solute carrier family 27 fatty acid transporter 1/4